MPLFLETGIPGLIVVEPNIFEDSRGYFFESYNDKVYAKNGINVSFVQDNQSKSSYGVIRGLHFQSPPYGQSKLVRVLSGAVLDVAVDIRKGSPTFGEVYSIELSSENKKQLFIPWGFAHGFSVISEYAEILYKCDKYYHQPAEGGILYNDPALAIDWRIPAGKAIISQKDIQLPSFKDLAVNFTIFKPE